MDVLSYTTIIEFAEPLAPSSVAELLQRTSRRRDSALNLGIVTMNAPTSSTVMLLVLIPLVGWRVYTRFRRMVGRQRMSKIRLRITLAIYTTLVILLCLAGHAHPERLLWLAGGLCFGSLLGIFGLRQTRFEPTKQGLFYTPHAHIGIALSLLFVARIVYRLLEVYANKATAQDNFARSPLTLAVFGLLAGYYVTYAIGLMRWRFRVIQAKRQRKALRLERGVADA